MIWFAESSFHKGAFRFFSGSRFMQQRCRGYDCIISIPITNRLALRWPNEILVDVYQIIHPSRGCISNNPPSLTEILQRRMFNRDLVGWSILEEGTIQWRTGHDFAGRLWNVPTWTAVLLIGRPARRSSVNQLGVKTY